MTQMKTSGEREKALDRIQITTLAAAGGHFDSFMDSWIAGAGAIDTVAVTPTFIPNGGIEMLMVVADGEDRLRRRFMPAECRERLVGYLLRRKLPAYSLTPQQADALLQMPDMGAAWSRIAEALPRGALH